MKPLHIKTLIFAFVILLISGCSSVPSSPVYYDPVAASMLQYSGQMLQPQYYGNPYVRPAMHTTCVQTGNFVNCNSF